jgi:hypothetical protein
MKRQARSALTPGPSPNAGRGEQGTGSPSPSIGRGGQGVRACLTAAPGNYDQASLRWAKQEPASTPEAELRTLRVTARNLKERRAAFHGGTLRPFVAGCRRETMEWLIPILALPQTSVPGG